MSQLVHFVGAEQPGVDRTMVPRRLRVLITVKAAPNPSDKSGETVCVAGLALDDRGLWPHWVRLYPINFRFLEQDAQFKQYDIVELDATPRAMTHDASPGSPICRPCTLPDTSMPSRCWKRRKSLLEPMLETSMCALSEENRGGATGRSLALVTPREVSGLRVSAHPGWTPAEQAKIDAYVNQLDLFSESDRTALEAPRLMGHYVWICGAPACRGHEQSIIDWEFVALQRKCRNLADKGLHTVLEEKFLDMMCHSGRRPAFYVGNQAKRHHVFHVLGVYYPK
jgi:hypothetical protein